MTTLQTFPLAKLKLAALARYPATASSAQWLKLLASSIPDRTKPFPAIGSHFFSAWDEFSEAGLKKKNSQATAHIIAHILEFGNQESVPSASSVREQGCAFVILQELTLWTWEASLSSSVSLW